MEVLTTAEMERADRLAIAAGTPGFALMLSAGQAVAEAAMDLVEEGPILVIAGRGNNGGDGFVAAAELAARGREVSVILLCERDSLQGDAASAARGWKFPVLPFNPQAIGRPALIIDALFGAGLNRPVKGDPLDMIEAINANGAPVLSVDLPSGVNGTTGAVMGVAVRATETVTFFRRKPAHLLLPGRIHCGRVRVADIGIDAGRTRRNSAADLREHSDSPGKRHFRCRRSAVTNTPAAMPLSSQAISRRPARRGCRRAAPCGPAPGWSRWPRPGMRSPSMPPRSPPSWSAPIDTVIEFAELLTDKRLHTCVIGPGAGVGARTRDFVLTALSAKRHLVLDADALTSFADAPDRLFQAIKAMPDPQVVLTPHDGEFPRLFSDISNKNPNRSKLERVRAAAERSGAIVLLKGADTVVASPDGRATIAANAPPWLATAGAGDVLAGMIAGLLAQGVPAFEAASIGVWMHGEAAREAGPGLIAEDLPEVLPAVFRRLYDEFGIDY